MYYEWTNLSIYVKMRNKNIIKNPKLGFYRYYQSRASIQSLTFIFSVVV